MSSQSPSTPLRDRALSNMHASSGHPWALTTASSGSQSSTISPLRIPKRDTPGRKTVATALARRSSSSYSHMRNNNLVSKSPFRAQIPSSAKPKHPPPPIQVPRKVSGEKRPRPSSMNDQAENEHPMGFKRRQSKGLQGLYQKEPVTKSPFRRTPDHEPTPEPDLPPPPRIDRQSTASPTRPSLVTKRFHGPRMVGFNLSSANRARRKTVTFDERCDVVEFDREAHELEDEEEDGYHTPRDGEEYDPYAQVSPGLESEPDHDIEHDSIEQEFGGSNGEDSITGLMDSLIHDSQLGDVPRTPPHGSDFPDDLETEDGVPLGRTHHVDRQAAYHEQLAREEHLNLNTPPPERSCIWSSPSSSPATPPVNRSLLSTSTSTGSGLLLGRTTHPERSATSRSRDEVEKDLQMLPPSPSPSKVSVKAGSRYQEGLIPSFDLPVPRRKSIPGALDPFDESPIKEGHQELPPADADIPPEEEVEPEPDTVADDEPLEPPPRLADTSLASNATPSGSPILPPTASRHASDAVRSRSGSPISRSASPFFMNKNSSSASIESITSLSGRSSRSPRISREDLHQRLIKKRSMDSPLREVVSSDIGSRHTNVYTIDPEPSEGPKIETVPFNTRMFPQRSSAEPSTNVSTDVDFREEVAEELAEEIAVVSARQNLEEIAFSETARRTSVAIEALHPADLGFGSNGEELADMRSALDRLVRDVASSGSEVHKPQASSNSSFVPESIKVEAVTEGIQAGTFQIPSTPVDDVYDDADEGEEDEDLDEPAPPSPIAGPSIGQMKLEISHDPTPLLGTGFGDFSASFGEGEGSVSSEHRETPPPPPPLKIGIKEREEIIKAKRREIRRLEEEEQMRYAPKVTPLTPGGDRSSRRRSRSTGDAAETPSRQQLSEKGALGMDNLENGDDPLSESINRELQKLEMPKKQPKQKYHVRERETMIIASSDADQVHHMSSAGDLNSGKAWRAVRRPSDMNEYSKQIKELRAQERTGKAHGKIFVKIVSIKSLDIPLPPQSTIASCTLNNGIHYVTTPEFELTADTKIEQEFELIEHSKLEFTLSFKVRRDPHIAAQMKASSHPIRQPVPPPPREVTPPPTKSRFHFFSSPKKAAKQSPRMSPAPAPVLPPKIEENLARYLKSDGSLARAFIAYKDVAAHCDTRLFETTIPLIGQRTDPEGAGTTTTTLQIGELILQLFRLPPLHGVAPTQLPQSLDECLRGLRHVSWHKVTYFEGTLTQNGGDCLTWKRRHFRIIGANMVAFNDVTKRAITTIDLKKAVSLHDDQERHMKTPASHTSSNSYDDEFDGPCGVEKSFKLLFPGNQRISFFSDTEADKARWLEVLGALVGRIPPNPLWAELLWQKQQENMAKHTA